jgi:hypothetical protein
MNQAKDLVAELEEEFNCCGDSAKKEQLGRLIPLAFEASRKHLVTLSTGKEAELIALKVHQENTAAIVHLRAARHALILDDIDCYERESECARERVVIEDISNKEELLLRRQRNAKQVIRPKSRSLGGTQRAENYRIAYKKIKEDIEKCLLTYAPMPTGKVVIGDHTKNISKRKFQELKWDTVKEVLADYVRRNEEPPIDDWVINGYFRRKELVKAYLSIKNNSKK